MWRVAFAGEYPKSEDEPYSSKEACALHGVSRLVLDEVRPIAIAFSSFKFVVVGWCTLNNFNHWWVGLGERARRIRDLKIRFVRTWVA